MFRPILHSILPVFVSFTLLAQTQGVSISSSGAAPDPSAGLEVNFTDKGFLPPRMTTGQRNSIVSPATGLTIFNTTTNCLEFNVGGVWQAIGCACAAPPPAPAAGAAVVTDGSVSWNWSASAGADGYKWNTSNNYATAVEVGTAIFYNDMTPPPCGQALTAYVWAYNACGPSSPTVLSATGPVCPFVCGNTLTINHVSGPLAPQTKTVGYVTVSYNGKCWIDRNLGADNAAASATDATDQAAGWYWQFNRLQGYAAGPSPSWNVNPIPDTGPWMAANDPCTQSLGADWHIPTESEWVGADTFGGWNNYFHTFSSPLKIHGAGYLFTSNGSLQDRGSYGLYWSNEAYGVTAGRTMRMNGTGAGMDNGYQASGFSVRCIRNS